MNAGKDFLDFVNGDENAGMMATCQKVKKTSMSPSMKFSR